VLRHGVVAVFELWMGGLLAMSRQSTKARSISSVGTWRQAQWWEAWSEIAELCVGVEADDPRMPRIQSYLDLFDQEFYWKDADWFFYALVRFRNGFPEKRRDK